MLSSISSLISLTRKGETMINDEERKRAVAELREASTGAYRHVDSLDVIANSIGVEVDGKFIHEVENETYAALADLIDRPTCHNVADYTKESFKCSECGCRVLVPGDRPDGVLVVTSEAFPVDWYLADLVDRGECENVYDGSVQDSCDNGFLCSVCGCKVEDEEHYRVSGVWNYCPQCGRKVRHG